MSATVIRTTAEVDSICHAIHELGSATAHLSLMGTTTIRRFPPVETYGIGMIVRGPLGRIERWAA